MKIAFKPEENQVVMGDSDVLSVFERTENKDDKNEIQQGMSPRDIAEIISDHLINVVRKQFEENTTHKQRA